MWVWDYFGPIFVKQGHSEVKLYGCLFTCLTMWAVHIEVTHTLEADSFNCAYQRFVSSRGIVQGDIQRQWYQFHWRKMRAERKHWNDWTKPKSTIVSEWTTFSGHLTLPRHDKYSKRWQQVQCLANLFWKIWMRDYLPAL